MLMFAIALTAQMATVDQLAWLSGCWTLARPDGVTEEQWMKPAGGTMLGMSRTVKGGKTVEYRVHAAARRERQAHLCGEAVGTGRNAVPGEDHRRREVVFENPTHDFPQRVIYRRTADGVTARIEGTMNGKLRGMDFVYKRCP